MKPANLIELARSRRPAEEVLAGLLSTNQGESLQAGLDLANHAKDLGLSARDYLQLAVDPAKGNFANAELDGYQTALMAGNLPVKDDFAKGVVLQAAAETFQTFPGMRALFPEVMDDIVQWKYRQDQLESADGIVAQSRTVNGVEMITTVMGGDDDAENMQQFGRIAERGTIPVRKIEGTEHGVKFYKYGGGYEWTYEFARRASLDVMTPYASRMQREIEIGKLATVTQLLINGDPVHPGAQVVNAKTLATGIGATYAKGKIDWEVFLKWLVSRAQAGVPVDTIVGNWDMHFEWMRMFAKPSLALGTPQIEALRAAGVQAAEANPRLNFNVNFQVSSTAPAEKLIGFSKADTVEELKESGSDIAESMAAMSNQTVKYVRTENTGYRLVFGDTRSILDLSVAA
jgi:hypothetical protein